MDAFNKRLARLIVENRKKSGKSQVEVAEATGISFRTYQRIEAGEISPRTEVTYSILSVLDVKPSNFFVEAFKEGAKGPQESGAESVVSAHQSWDSQMVAGPMLIDSAEVEGVKRALAHDFERGLGEIGYWEWNLSTSQFYWSDQNYLFYDLEREPVFNYEKFLSRIEPEDIKKINDCVDGLVNHDIPYDETHRVNTRFGQQVIRSVAKKYKNSQGQIIVFGISEVVKPTKI